MKSAPKYKDGEPCGHPGCLSHITHPCENCGRIDGRPHKEVIEERLEKSILLHSGDVYAKAYWKILSWRQELADMQNKCRDNMGR